MQNQVFDRMFSNPAASLLHCLKAKHGADWRKYVKHQVTPESLGRGANAGTPVWCTHAGEYFRNERFADEVCRKIGHKGWYTDDFCDSTIRGIVASLPHNRFIAGYYWSENGERVWYPEIFSDDTDAASMADEHARVAAESEREFQEEENARIAEEEQEDRAFSED